MVYSVIMVLVLHFVVLWFILRGDLFLFFVVVFFCRTLCYFVLGVFSPFSIASTSLGEES